MSENTSKAAKAEKAPTKAKAPAKPKAEKAPKEKGLTARQVRILTALAKAPNELGRAELAEKAEVDVTGIDNAAGYTDPEVNAWSVHAGNLLNRGFVTVAGENGKTTFAITEAGRKALAAAKKKEAK